MIHLIPTVFTLTLSFAVMNLAYAEEGVTNTEITFGMTNATSGINAEYGNGIKIGTEVYFRKVNQQGGIHGRKLKLVHYDDAYDPKKALENVTTLVEKDKVLALVGFFGTPTIRAAFSYLQRTRVPFLFPRSGSTFLRDPVESNIFTLNAGYADEARALVDYFVDTLHLKNIAIFEQDDALGAEGRGPITKSLVNHGLKLAGDGKYNRESLDIQPALEELKKVKPEAIITFGVSTPTLNFIHAYGKNGGNPYFGVSTPAMTQKFLDGIGAVQHLFRTEVMPDLTETDYSVVKNYLKDMKDAGQTHFDQNSLRAYASAIVLVESLKRAGKDLSRAKLLSTLESLKDFDIGGLKVSFSPQNHQGMQTIFLDQIKDSRRVRIKVLNQAGPSER